MNKPLRLLVATLAGLIPLLFFALLRLWPDAAEWLFLLVIVGAVGCLFGTITYETLGD